MKKSTYGSLVFLLLFYSFITCGEKAKSLTTAQEQPREHQVWEINENNYTLHVETIDSINFYKEKKAAKVSSAELEKITDFKIVKKLLKGVIEYEETEYHAAIKKINFKNGTSWRSRNDEESFVAYYPTEDIIVMEGGHSSDLSFNLNNGKAIEETGNPKYLKTSIDQTYRLNGFYDGQECITYFIEKNIKDQFEKVIPLSEELNKDGKIRICHADDGFWKDDQTLLLREIHAYGENGEQLTVFYKITVVDANLPKEKAESKTNVSDFIPEGWKEILRETGDLNGDGMDDQVLVIEDTKPENLKENESLGPPLLNLNPRTLLIFFAKKNGGFILAAKNGRGFIESENSEINPCLSDPLLENGNITIANSLLKIQFHYWLSCGSNYVNNASYTFRFQNDRFKMIGYDHKEFNRTSGETANTSINFLSKKMSNTTGKSMFEDNESKGVTTWRKIKVHDLYDLELITDNIYHELLN